MEIYNELQIAISEVVSGLDEKEKFKRQFNKLIENYYADSVSASEIENIVLNADFTEDESEN
ncbi:hypothetical protein [Dorea sp. D27]|uniref:hypothetical protein n=1 Tax=Dorea sp. D27 TaxID=658665 RepID=UPI00067350EE|nr:hypothetical protein [Dorea sp. D27]KMZ53070.1 trigger factor (TF) [Dorea sp. D27]